MQNKEEITKTLHKALDVMGLPVLVSFEDIKKRYRELSKLYHPDFNQEEDRMRSLNESYALLKHYVFHYRFSFSDEEIQKQYPESDYGRKFRF